MARIFFIAIAVYLVYRVIFDLILPVYKTTKHMKSQFNNMHDQTRQNNNQEHSSNFDGSSHASTTREKVGEYIDFEETKN